MNKKNLHKILQYALLCARQNENWKDRELGPIHLIKYAYLADLIYAETHDGETYSETNWKFHNFGPWALEVYNEIPHALNAIGAEVKGIPSSYGDEDFYRWLYSADDHEEVYEKLGSEVPLALTFTIRNLVRQFGQDTPDLLDHVYNTKPMLHAAPGDLLNLSVLPTQRKSSEEFVSAMENLSVKKRKRLRERIQDVREKIRTNKEQSTSEQLIPSKLPPIDDNVLREGLDYLDGLAGSPLPEGGCEVEFDDSVWRSSVRKMERY